MGKTSTIDKLQAALSRLQEAEDALASLDAARELRELADSIELTQVRAARDQGVAWSKIGKLYGLTKQGAQQRFRQHLEPAPDAG
ncbi:hypothetical protein SAMN02745244_02698 [Tessaracoccus bendigoensis DSM 12906]|uniref:Uncharacterized protein n=1 Tax=Tessaracoccus bendigoensis DSM 12906 TaxID=1123357 RepID=A0A1M6JZY2_9ACTN|nr:hypothetical protein [Tessaracoccus bendigoensis]SHJ52227.1 hypothetical protein SAMN02745244_02698 [Tessaracoccus bendigoensis DSM 12906]